MTLILEEHPNRVAERLTGRDYLSYSAITTFQSCPLKWYFRYVADLPEEVVSSSLIFGGAIHRAVEHHFRELLAGNQQPDLDTLLYEYLDAWSERDVGTIRFARGEWPVGLLDPRMKETYRRRWGIQTDSTLP